MASSRRLFALAVGTSIAALLAWGFLRLRGGSGEQVGFFVPSPEEALRSTAPELRTAGSGTATGLVRWTIPPEAAEQLFPLDGLGQVYDPVTNFRYPSNLRERRQWPDGTGRWNVVTNGQGLRENEDVAAEPVDLRVLVTGDSHTDGVCRNRQSFPNRLEEHLAQARPGASIDCINAGKGGYSFYEYLGVLEKFADLRPDLFVVTVYGGNDIFEVLTLRRYFLAESHEPLGEAEYGLPLRRVRALDSRALAQGLLLVKYFQLRPDDVERGFETSVQLLEAIQARCEAEGIELLLLYLPPWFEVQRDRYDTPWDELMTALEVDAEDVQLVPALGDRLLAAARDRGVEVLDLRPSFCQAERELYWPGEWHLHPRGHALVARELGAWVDERFPVDG